jgi:hypothetical protein
MKRKLIALLDPAYNIVAKDLMQTMEGKSNLIKMSPLPEDIADNCDHVIQRHAGCMGSQKYARKGPPQIHQHSWGLDILV